MNWPTKLAALFFGTFGMFAFFFGAVMFSWLPLLTHIFQIGAVVIGFYCMSVGALVMHSSYQIFRGLDP